MLLFVEGWKRCFCDSHLVINVSVHLIAVGQQLGLQLVHLLLDFPSMSLTLGPDVCLAHDKVPAFAGHPHHQDERQEDCHGPSLSL